MFEHCVLARYNDVISADCYSGFYDAMKVIEQYNKTEYYDNHIKYCHIWKYWPENVKKIIINRKFDVPIRYFHL